MANVNQQNKDYGDDFYEGILEGSLRSARKFVPVVLRLVSPQSVIDVGCGSGTWLRSFQENGIRDLLGVDGGKAERLQIDESFFCKVDLARPFRFGRQFDMAVSMEVAEHLPVQRAQGFVEDLTGLAPVVLFSAAVPGQGGTHHLNEQWPDYWARIFAGCGYVAWDGVRQLVWEDVEIEWWYRQNAILYFHRDLANQRNLDKGCIPLRLIHPEMLNDPRVAFRVLRGSVRQVGRLLRRKSKPRNLSPKESRISERKG